MSSKICWFRWHTLWATSWRRRWTAAVCSSAEPSRIRWRWRSGEPHCSFRHEQSVTWPYVTHVTFYYFSFLCIICVTIRDLTLPYVTSHYLMWLYNYLMSPYNYLMLPHITLCYFIITLCYSTVTLCYLTLAYVTLQLHIGKLYCSFIVIVFVF